MLSAFSTYILSYTWLILLAVGAWLLGYLVCFPFRRLAVANGIFTHVFIRLLAGSTVTVLIVSLLVTGARTVHIALLLPAAFLLWELWRMRRETGSAFFGFTCAKPAFHASRYIPHLFCASLFLFAWFARLTFDPNSEFGYLLADKDKIYYATLAEMLSLGQENRAGIFNQLDAFYHGTAPYHYFELWLTNIYAQLTATNPATSLYVFTYPFLNLVALLGILALIERYRAVTALYFCLAVLLLFTSGLYLDQHKPDAWYTMNFAESPMEFMGEKFAGYYPFALLAILFFLGGAANLALITLLFVPAVSISTAPGVLLSAGLLALIPVFRKGPARAAHLRLLLYIAAVALFLFCFYQWLGIRENTYLAHSPQYYTDIQDASFKSFKIFFAELLARVWSVPFRFLLLYALLPVLVLLVYRKAGNGYRSLLLFTTLVYFISLLLYCAFYKLFEGVQFYTNDLVFVNLFAIVSIVIFLTQARSVPRNALGALLILVLTIKVCLSFRMHNLNRDRNQVYSPGYLAAVKHMMSGTEERQLVAALYADSPPDRDLRHDDRSGINIPYLPYLPSCYPAVDISANEIRNFFPVRAIGEAQALAARQTPFMRQVMHEIRNGTFKTYQQSQLDFVTKNKIKYLVISPHAQRNQGIEERVVEEVRDTRSGERFVRLR